MKQIKSITRISSETWLKHRGLSFENDLFMVEIDCSYNKGFLSFSHELSLIFYLDNGKLNFIEGSEISLGDHTYFQNDWPYLKEKFLLSDGEIIEEIKKAEFESK